MIRIVSIQPVAEAGGSDRALLRTIRTLPSDRFEVHVVAPAPHPLEDDLRAAGARVHVVPMRRITGSGRTSRWLAYAAGWPSAVARLARLVRRLDADVVHSNSIHSWYGWAAAALTRRPHVWHAREIVVQSRAALALERFLARRFATRVVAISEAVAAQFDPSNVVVRYDAADPDEFRPERAGRFRRHLGIPDDVPLVSVVGRIDTWKGVDVVLDAFPDVAARCPGARLVVAGPVVAGKEDYAAELAVRAAATPGVVWCGATTEVADLLADSDAVAVASTEPEPYGLVAVEALMSGAPVVATDAGGLPEVAARATAGAVRLVPPGDAEQLAAALAGALAGASRDASARAGRPRLLDPSGGGAAGEVASVFEEAVAAGRR